MRRRVLLTGLSSFTGSHIGRAFVEAGFDVAATLSQPRSAYSGLLEERLLFSGVQTFVENAKFGSDELLAWIKSHKIDVFVNHGASIKNYRSPDFDYWKSVEQSTYRMKEILESLVASGCKRLLHTGSFFESGEGCSVPQGELSDLSPAMSIYGVSKRLTWELLRYKAQNVGLSLSKIVIPNPIGNFENLDRLAPIFVKMWREAKRPELRTPDHVRDNLPAEWLALVYVEEAMNEGGGALRVCRPQGFVMTQKQFVEELSRRVQPFLGKACEFDVKPMPSLEQVYRVNTEPSKELEYPANIEAFWSSWLSYLLRS